MSGGKREGAFFAYGTLMCADILAGVAGSLRPGRPARLWGFARRLVRGQDYPGIEPAAGAVVPGILYRGLGPAAWERLDRFEGDMYLRQRVAVQGASGVWWSAQTYVVRPAAAARLSAEQWDLAQFLAAGKTRFTAEYQGFRALTGVGK